MAHMLIYRYEEEYGIGPCWDGCIAGKWQHLPAPADDGIRHMGVSERCGCKCRNTLRRWFKSDIRRTVKDHGYNLAVYQVPDHLVKVGNLQVVFDPKDATSVRKKNRSGTSTSTDQGQARV